MTVRTRFAPSPTGYLHIGGVRTALFCWLFAKKHGGKFVLRIDDTDQQRNVQEALEPILHGLVWLGLKWDEGPDVDGPYGPYYQSQRWKDYQEAVERLLASGHAYRDYATTEEIAAEREAAQAEKRPFTYSRRWMAETDEQSARFEAEGRKSVVRLKMPREGTLVIDDLVRGRVEFDWAQEQDHVIQRADGSCLYHLASTVDDHAMEITHVIRAEEHLSNTPRQVFIAQSLGFEPPRYAHLPFVAEPGSRTKLSKRKLNKYLKHKEFAQRLEHGRKIAERINFPADPEVFNPVMTRFYEAVGYEPEAIVNYLALLGWSLDDSREFFSREELIEHFSLDRVNKAPAGFDPQKLWAFEEHYYEQLATAEKTKRSLPYLQLAGVVSSPIDGPTEAYVERVVAACGERLRVAGDILEFDELFLPDDQLPYDDKAVEKRLRKDGAADCLKKFRAVLADVEPFESDALEAAMKEFVEREGIKIGQIIHPVRVATTGKQTGIGMFDALALLGRESCLRRIDRALELG